MSLAQDDGRGRTLRRVLGSWDGAAIGIGIVIGSGIFVTPGMVARQTGSVGWSMAAWTLGGFLALVDALIIAELAALYPRAGGNYVYLKNAYGPFPAFLNGWLSSLVTYPASLAALAVFFAQCVSRLHGRGDAPSLGLAAGVLVALALLNALGIQYGRVTQDVFALGKIACLAAIVVMAFVLDPAAPSSIPPPPTVPRGLAILPAMGAALLGVMWTYDGYADIAVMGGEIRRPGRSIPRALVGTMLVITAVYLLANAAFFLVLPLPLVAASSLVISDVAGALLGPRADTVVTAMAMVSAFGALNGVLMAGPRITYAIARDGLMFPALSRLSRGQTPVAALALQVGMAMLLMGVPTPSGASAFDVLTGTSIFVIWLISFFASLSLLVFRIRYPDAPRPFRLPLYPWSFVVHLLVSAGFLASTVYHESEKVWMGLLILAAGGPAYLVWRAVAPAQVTREAPAPEDPKAEG